MLKNIKTILLVTLVSATTGCPEGTVDVYGHGHCVPGPTATIVKPSGCNRRFLRSSSSGSLSSNTQQQQRGLGPHLPHLMPAGPMVNHGGYQPIPMTNGCNFQTGENIEFSGTGHGDNFVWSSSIDGHLGSGKTLSQMLMAGTHIITLRVWFAYFTATDTITVKVAPGPGVPTVSIFGPTTSSIQLDNFNNKVTLEANALDPEDGALVGDSVVWRSDKQGLLGKGPVVQNVHFRDVSNCGGREWHTVTCTATDSDGNYVTDTIDVSVAMPPC